MPLLVTIWPLAPHPMRRLVLVLVLVLVPILVPVRALELVNTSNEALHAEVNKYFVTHNAGSAF